MVIFESDCIILYLCFTCVILCGDAPVCCVTMMLVYDARSGGDTNSTLIYSDISSFLHLHDLHQPSIHPPSTIHHHPQSNLPTALLARPAFIFSR